MIWIGKSLTEDTDLGVDTVAWEDETLVRGNGIWGVTCTGEDMSLPTGVSARRDSTMAMTSRRPVSVVDGSSRAGVIVVKGASRVVGVSCIVYCSEDTQDDDDKSDDGVHGSSKPSALRAVFLDITPPEPSKSPVPV